MKNVRNKHLSMAVGGSVASGARHLASQGHGGEPDAAAFLDLVAQQRKPSVLHAMPTIRWLMSMHRFQVDSYSDDALADALLETCPRPDDFWLRTEHLALAVQRVSSARKRDTAS
jgi:hypothetical protein